MALSRSAGVAVALGVIYVVWSTTFMAIRAALDGLPPFLLCTLRYLTAALIMGAIAGLMRGVRPSAREVWGACALGAIIVLAPNAPVAWAEQTLPTGVTALLGACNPLFVLAIGAFSVGGDRPTRRGALGIGLGLAGMGVLIGPQLGQGVAGQFVAQASMVAGSFVTALGMVYGRHLPVPSDGMYRSAISMGAGGLMFAVVALGRGEPGGVVWSTIPGHAWLGLAYLVVFGSCVGFSAFTFLVAHARPALTSTISFVNPAMAMVIGVAVLGEPLPPTVLAATVMIVLAVVLVAVGGRNHAPTQESAPAQP